VKLADRHLTDLDECMNMHHPCINQAGRPARSPLEPIEQTGRQDYAHFDLRLWWRGSKVAITPKAPRHGLIHGSLDKKTYFTRHYGGPDGAERAKMTSSQARSKPPAMHK
jgi:hypothetical protein